MKKNKGFLSSRFKNFFARKDTKSEFVKYFLYGVFSILALFVITLAVLSPNLPGFDQLERVYDAQTLSTIIYSDDGEVLQITSNKSEGRRMWLSYNEIPKVMIDAVIATEDTRFYSHWGISLPDIMRAALKNVLHIGIPSGASTITQQLARSQWLTRKQTLYRKMQEALLAIKIEHTYSKPEILELFLNRMNFGGSFNGIEAASRGYFGKPAAELTVPEAALLAGLLQAPSRYNPRRNPENAENRRNTVLMMMANAGFITRDQAKAEIQKPIELASMSGGEYGKAPFFVDYVCEQLLQKYGEEALNSMGLKVYTTLDYRLQKVAEAALSKQIEYIQKNYADKLHWHPRPGLSPVAAIKDSLNRTAVQGALVAIDVRTGAILAMVGGRGYDRSNQFNRATQAIRQAGSCFKPFDYTAALDNGWKISDTIIDSQFSKKSGDGTWWTPDNYDGTYSGRAMTLREAIKKSINSVAAKLVNDPSINCVGPATVVKYATRMGITTPIKPYPSIAIGTAGVKLLDLTSAYTVFPNLGIRTEPIAIRTIKDKNDNQKQHLTEGAKREALRPEVASLMVTMLRSVCQGGTAATKIAASAMKDRPCGGKTGTGNEFKDTWFVGFTPYICCGVWIGFDSEETTLNRYYGTGATAPLPVWIDFMTQASEILGQPKNDFKLSSGVVAIPICKYSNRRATGACPERYTEYYIRGSEITQFCPIHSGGGESPGLDSRSFNQQGGERKENRGF